MSNGQKISQFNVLTSLLDSASLTVVSGGQNYTIPFSTFKTLLGVTGTLESVGDPLGVPVLSEPVSGQYEIKSLEDGAGIIFNTTVEGGAQAKWNVLQDATGLPVANSLTSLQPVLSSLVAGTGMVLTQNGNAITITATGEANPNNTVIINVEADFTVQDATTITLEAGKIYQIADNISTAKYFIVQDKARFTANNFFSPVFTYTGTGTMFVGVDASFQIDNCRIDHPNAQGFEFTDTVGGQKLFLMDTVRTVSGTNFGTFNNMQTLSIGFSSTLDMDQGVTVTGTDWAIITASKFFQQSTSGSFVAFDLTTAISSTLELDDLIAVAPAGSIGIKGAAASANVPAGVVATVSGCNFSGVTTPLSGITEDDIRWRFSGNSAIPNSMSDALISIAGSSTVTTISTINVPVKFVGTFTSNSLSRFSHDGAGRITYIGETAERHPIDITTTILMNSGGDKQVSVYVAINGSIVTNTGKQGTASSTKAASITTFWQHTFVNGDYVEIFLENNSDAIDIIGQQAVFRVN